MSYEPRGKVKALLDAMSADPQRIWSSVDAAKVLGVPEFRSTLLAYTDSACRNGLMFRRMTVGGDLQFRLIAFDVAAEATVWKPPQMVAPRGTPAPAPAATSASAPIATAPPAPTQAPQPPAGKRESKLETIRADIAADMEPRGDRANRVLVDRLHGAMLQWTPPAVASSPEPSAPPEPAGAADASIQEEAGGEEQPAAEFNAKTWLDGDLDLYGLIELEDGGHRIQAKDVARLRRMIAWLPA